jgi:hypothetical protein
MIPKNKRPGAGPVFLLLTIANFAGIIAGSLLMKYLHQCSGANG